MENNKFSIFNVYLTNGLYDNLKLQEITQRAIENNAHVLDKGKHYVIMGFEGNLNNFCRATGIINEAHISLEEQLEVKNCELGGSD